VVRNLLVSLVVTGFVCVGLLTLNASPPGPPDDIARLDRRTDVLSYSVWGPNFAEDLKEFEPLVPHHEGETVPRTVQAFVAPLSSPNVFAPQPAPEWTVFVFHSEHCQPCRRLVAETLLPMARSNWTTGPYGDSTHFQLIDGEKHPDLVDACRVREFPTMVVLKKGVEVARRTGYVKQGELADWVNSYVANKPAATQSFFIQRCGRRRCR
jgi:hypothetical protein